MRTTLATPAPKREGQVTSIRNRAGSQGRRDPGLIRCDEELNRATIKRVTKNEAARRLPEIRSAVDVAKRARPLVEMARYADDTETEDALRLALRQLENAAKA